MSLIRNVLAERRHMATLSAAELIARSRLGVTSFAGVTVTEMPGAPAAHGLVVRLADLGHDGGAAGRCDR